MNRKSGKIAFILEGVSREVKLKKQMESFFPFSECIQIIHLPAGCNIHMLWKQLEQDDFETDMIEILREKSGRLAKELDGLTRDDFQEIYLFFDLDIQHYEHIGMTEKEGLEYLEKMLRVFDNETEQGKLYISYPMLEAVRDLSAVGCKAASDCYYPVENLHDYKRNSVGMPVYTEIERYGTHEWEMLLSVFLRRCYCLLELLGNEISCNEYKVREIAPITIFHKEKQRIEEQREIFILSAFPEFILDYFPIDKLNRYSLAKDVLEYICEHRCS